jgi:hypothetical protein
MRSPQIKLKANICSSVPPLLYPENGDSMFLEIVIITYLTTGCHAANVGVNNEAYVLHPRGVGCESQQGHWLSWQASRGFPQSHQSNAGMLPKTRLYPLCSKSFQVLVRRHPVSVTASLNKHLSSGIQPLFVCLPPDVMSLQLCSPKLFVYNSTYTQSIIYIQNK